MITLLTVLGWLAWFGGILLFFRFVSMIFGDFFDSDVDTDHDFDTDHDMDNDTDHDSDHDGQKSGAKLFSFLGISSFFLMFGLVGRLCILLFELHWALSIIIAFVAGIGMMYLIGWIFYKAKSLESDGTTKIADAINCLGTVYLPMDNGTKGTVQVNVNGIMREYDSLSLNGELLKVGEKVIVKEIAGNLIKVVKNN